LRFPFDLKISHSAVFEKGYHPEQLASKKWVKDKDQAVLYFR
jgi:hypothetical protein